jgi:hypothetical protein
MPDKDCLKFNLEILRNNAIFNAKKLQRSHENLQGHFFQAPFDKPLWTNSTSAVPNSANNQLGPRTCPTNSAHVPTNSAHNHDLQCKVLASQYYLHELTKTMPFAVLCYCSF